MEDFYKTVLNLGVYAPLGCALAIACLWPFVSARAAKALSLAASAVLAAAGIALWCAMPADGSFGYWRDEQGVHYVPKRALADLVLKRF